MRRVTLQFPAEGEGQDMVLHADVDVGWRWTVTPPAGEGNPWTETTGIDAPYIDLNPTPGVPYDFKVELIDRAAGTALGFTHQGALTWPAQSVRMPISFTMGMAP